MGSKLVPLYVYGAHVEGCDQADATAAFYDKVFNVLEAAAQSNQPERVEVDANPCFALVLLAVRSPL